jgi:hypothetical protein
MRLKENEHSIHIIPQLPVILRDINGDLNMFFFDFNNKGHVGITQLVEGRIAQWEPRNEDGENADIKNTKDALNFLSKQGYNNPINQKGGNDK